MAINQPIQQKKPNQTATGYTNIQRILQANKSNQLGSTVAGGVNQAGQAARGAINQAGQQFKTEAEKENERLTGQKATADRVLGNVIGATKDDVKSFEDIRSGKSQGPKGIQNADEIQKKTREAEALGSAASSEGGRYGLLQRFVGGNKQYTGGQQRVDNMLLGQTGADQLRSARQNTLGLSAAANTQEAGAIEVGKTLQNQAKNLADTTINRLGEQVVDYDTAMDKARIKSQEELKALQNRQREQLLGNNIIDEDLFNSLGINEGDQIWRSNLADYYQAMNNVATKQNVQTQEDFNRINALQRLSGNSLTGQASAVLPTYSDRSQIDAFKNMDTFKYDQDALAGKLASEKGLYQGAVAHPTSRLNFINQAGIGGTRAASDIINQSHLQIGDPRAKEWVLNNLGTEEGREQLTQWANAIDPATGNLVKDAIAIARGNPDEATLNRLAYMSNINAGSLTGAGSIHGFIEKNQQQKAIDAAKQTHQFARTLKRTPAV